MDPLTIGLIMGGGSILGKMFSKTPDFQRLDRANYMLGSDYEYDPETDFGQSTAADNMSRYGMGGAYNSYIKGETEALRKSEMNRILKMATSMVPGMASLRGGVSAQGAGGSVSNVIARQQREQMQGRALDAADSMYEKSVGGINMAELNMLSDSEKMRYSSSQDYMKAVGMGTEAKNQALRFNVGNRFERDRLNMSNALSIEQFNRTGQMKADEMRFGKWNSIFDDLGGMGGTMLGHWAGSYDFNGESDLDYFKKPITIDQRKEVDWNKFGFGGRKR